MLIWKGYGLLALGVPVASLFVAAALHFAIFGKEGMAEQRDYLMITWGILSSVATWKIGKKINRMRVRVTDADGNVTERWERDISHTLYMLPFEYWAVIYFITTAIFALSGFIAQ